MNILVTGGAGFIGSEFVRAGLRGQLPGSGDDRITVLDALTYSGNPANLAPVADRPGYRFVHGDICDPAVVDETVRGHEVIVHFAAETHVDRSISGPGRFVRTNVLGTQVLLEAALRHGVRRFVHVSSDEVYGSIDQGSWTEESPVDPTAPYAATKAGSDLMALSFHRTFGMDVVVTRCTNNYGWYQFPEKLIPLFVTNLLDGLPVPLYGDGENRRDWLHVSDHCRAIQLVLREGRAGEVYHIGGGDELSNREITGLLLDACGAGWDRVEHVTDRLGHDRRYSLDATKIREELGFVPRIGFAEGLRSVIEWYRDNRSWWEPLRTRAMLASRDGLAA
ncbi:dTDP-glucose 4,6-dehydratase [Actinomadura livida]|uniref:dTDP-glucose 4,6-dehydratase n=1 Tax=Actinomadura livida TaxID=79909 RepID=A0A7W7I8H9_9ACTN|nr:MULTISPECIES: dTDP-glucose 4,6-dehydratase [Actinomadura]MBB4772395.1 dTDP-glucose 4,6-dehydratase [Actinomadura catellatispora]GGU23232.1 dTDP-glucose 4,6-dehydratase [Actinomadura livida]